MRTLVSTLAVLICGVAILFASTNGLRAFSSEGARRLAVAENPRAVPNVLLENHDGRRVWLADWQGKQVVVDFIYTRCDTFCVAMRGGLKALQDVLQQTGRNDVALLSVSFDGVHDTPERLAYYAEQHGVDASRWTFARLADPGQLETLLEVFGITVIPDGFGGFEHNAGLHLVDASGRLARIVDYDDPGAMAEVVGLAW